jgi:hypothetical protein
MGLASNAKNILQVATNINEAATLKFAVDNELGGENPTQGIWMGGNQ